MLATGVMKHISCAIRAAAALSGHTGIQLERVKTGGTLLDCLGDVPVRNSAADTDDHDAAPWQWFGQCRASYRKQERFSIAWVSPCAGLGVAVAPWPHRGQQGSRSARPCQWRPLLRGTRVLVRQQLRKRLPSGIAASSAGRPGQQGRSGFPDRRCALRCHPECARGCHARRSPARFRNRRSLP